MCTHIVQLQCRSQMNTRTHLCMYVHGVLASNYGMHTLSHSLYIPLSHRSPWACRRAYPQDPGGRRGQLLRQRGPQWPLPLPSPHHWQGEGLPGLAAAAIGGTESARLDHPAALTTLPPAPSSEEGSEWVDTVIYSHWSIVVRSTQFCKPPPLNNYSQYKFPKSLVLNMHHNDLHYGHSSNYIYVR